MKRLNTIKGHLKNSILMIAVLSISTSLQTETVKAQEVTLTPGVEYYSTYVFRGIAFSGPSIQPYVEFEAGSFAFGGWGSQGFDGFQEMDLYATYAFDFGLSIGFTDYYYPGSDYFSGDSHAFEINTGIETGGISLSGNMVLNEAAAAGSVGGDLYFEAGFSVGPADLFFGAGDGWHSSSGDFSFVNIGLGASKEIEITESFTIPLSGALILNPDTEQFYIVVGVSL